MIEPPVIRPSRNGGCRIDSRATSSGRRPSVSTITIEKIIVAAPTTAVPISTGLAVALKVLPAPSFSSRNCLARSKSGAKPKSFLISAAIPGTDSIVESSNTDCALSVTGPYESTAMVTGPMPRKPKATRPKANTDGATISDSSPCALMNEPMPIRNTIVRPSQYAEKLPATRPDRMLSEAPPSSELLTTSRTWLESTDVNTFTSSGMIAPASVPQVMMLASFHHRLASPPIVGISRYDVM